MASSLSNDLTGTPRHSLPERSGGPLKADTRPEDAGTLLRDVAAEALKRVTSQKVAAIDIKISEGRLSSKLKDGSLTLKQLEALGSIYGQRLGEVCREAYGTEDPQARIRRAIREAQQKIAEVAEALP